mmetsp:Transcript_60133/g.127391  ORF Transcript_60133/g.127391 Transcript_60133/m.127391 type:complete len:522 (+) Transcript_60133:132-1697(+)|eukprot:CAMPEP_0206436296 /NCGR_PEP_ID=MMETSP0324_2-20121206/10400_1 /ASSEMBLY_ACC=CAM_ASM_000836 /TAXON_ID=2866 /ORGANISM="Crypthecodinium cohnii, Strain Seligo" /LENGTH=521 /DNA_ID=CAMNT_0053903437 /DNA_START=92 /DNA_END=1657 /DNA_ORIENTATION=+
MLAFDCQTPLPSLIGADYVHDVAYDYYGTRLAVCTSNLRISVFSLIQTTPQVENAKAPGVGAVGSGTGRAGADKGNRTSSTTSKTAGGRGAAGAATAVGAVTAAGAAATAAGAATAGAGAGAKAGTGAGGEAPATTSQWVETAVVDRAHKGPIWRLCWGHPEFGEPLASCSEDGSVCIWNLTNRTPAEVTAHANAATAAAAAASNAALSEVTAQAHAGYDDSAEAKAGEGGGGGAAAAVAASGAGVAAGMGIGAGVYRNAKHDHQVKSRQTLNCECPVVDVKFCPVAIGLKVACGLADGKVKIWNCQSKTNLKQWVCTADLNPTPQLLRTKDKGRMGDIAKCTSAALDWMPVAYDRPDFTEVLALGGYAGCLHIWANTAEGWKSQATMTAHPLDKGGVKDVAWCPNLCRGFEIVATCGAGAKLWRVEFHMSGNDGIGGEDNIDWGGPLAGYKETHQPVTISPLQQLVTPENEICPIWRCSWSLSGTALAISPDGGEVSVWKAHTSSVWRQECNIDLAEKES